MGTCGEPRRKGRCGGAALEEEEREKRKN